MDPPEGTDSTASESSQGRGSSWYQSDSSAGLGPTESSDSEYNTRRMFNIVESGSDPTCHVLAVKNTSNVYTRPLMPINDIVFIS